MTISYSAPEKFHTPQSTATPCACAADEADVWRQRIERWSRIVPADDESRILLHAAIGYAHQVEARLLRDAEAGR